MSSETTSVEELILQAFGARLQSVFKFSNPPLMVTTSAHVVHAALSKESNAGSKPLSYPLTFYRLSDIEGDGARYSSVALAYSPMHTAADNDTQGMVKLVPVTFTLEVSYLDNDFGRALTFASRWCLAGVDGSLNFVLRIDGAPLPIYVRPAVSVSLPTKDINTDGVNHYEIQLSAEVGGYISGRMDSSLYRVALCKEMAFSVQASAQMPVPPPLSTNYAYIETAVENTGLPENARPMIDIQLRR